MIVHLWLDAPLASDVVHDVVHGKRVFCHMRKPSCDNLCIEILWSSASTFSLGMKRSAETAVCSNVAISHKVRHSCSLTDYEQSLSEDRRDTRLDKGVFTGARGVQPQYQQPLSMEFSRSHSRFEEFSGVAAQARAIFTLSESVGGRRANSSNTPCANPTTNLSISYGPPQGYPQQGYGQPQGYGPPQGVLRQCAVVSCAKRAANAVLMPANVAPTASRTSASLLYHEKHIASHTLKASTRKEVIYCGVSGIFLSGLDGQHPQVKPPKKILRSKSLSEPDLYVSLRQNHKYP
ncbi:hypothetical protein Q3G72_002517 [Acer saccharum]|nr:hypothetical protein Q3G72_002517 [Acer saccharum]